MKKTVDEAVSEIVSAANGIGGAALVGDVTYASGRRADLGVAAEHLRHTSLRVDDLLAKADNMVAACRRRDPHTATQLNIEIGEMLAPFCD